MGDGGLEALGLDELTSLDDLLVALGAERDIDPSGELVLEIPGRLSVTDKDESRLVGSLSSSEAIAGSQLSIRQCDGEDSYIPYECNCGCGGTKK